MKYQRKMQIDLEKLANNIKKLCKYYDNYDYKIADLKDNGHGLGFKIVNTMEAVGINYVIVGSIKEGLEIRKFNKTMPILVNYFINGEEIYDCINNNLTVTIFNKECLNKILNLKIKDSLKVQILVDNGSNLMGINSQKELNDVIASIDNEKKIILEGIYSEITTMGINDEYYYTQINNFNSLVKDYLNRNLMIHLNEPLMYHEKPKFVNGLRFDLSILGLPAIAKNDFFTNLKIKNIDKKYGDLQNCNLNLELVFNISSEVMTIRNVTKGTIIGRNYIAKKDIVVATVPVGYKDGITKALKNVSINGEKREILTDEIDHIIVMIDNTVKEKDVVYIINGVEDIKNILSIIKTNRYYLMSVLNRNLTRQYINDIERNEDYL